MIQFLAIIFLLFPGVVFASEEEHATFPQVENLTVIELYSSQACVFCPEADANLAELSKQENIIALACHVDYFRVREGSLSQPFCTQRQTAYESTLQSGPKYTPQMVINGQIDVAGHHHTTLSKTLQNNNLDKISSITIQSIPNSQTYTVSLPELQGHLYTLWLAAYDVDQSITVSSGANRGKEMRYVNIISDMKKIEDWDGNAKLLKLSANLNDMHKGFAILAQATGGSIIAAGRFEREPVE